MRFEKLEDWEKLIKAKVVENYPFDISELSMVYLDIRRLLIFLYDISNSSIIELTVEIKQKINDFMKSLKSGGTAQNLVNILRILEKKSFRKDNKPYPILKFISGSPFCPQGHPLPTVIMRKCGNCGNFSINQSIPDDSNLIREGNKKILGVASSYKQICTCKQCSKQVPLSAFICPICNPQDDKGNYFYIDQLAWDNDKIAFETEFYTKILKGLSYEQQIYQELTKSINPNHVLLSHRIIPMGESYGFECDILFAEEFKSQILDDTCYRIWVIEAKNWASPVPIEIIYEFWKKLSKVNIVGIFCSKSGFDFFDLTKIITLQCNPFDLGVFYYTGDFNGSRFRELLRKHINDGYPIRSFNYGIS